MLLYDSLLCRLQVQHQAIAHLIANSDNALLKKEVIPGKWSVHDNIAHLAKYQPVFIKRIHAILQEEEPTFERYVAEQDDEFEEWRSRETTVLLAQMEKDRQQIIEIITACSEDQLKRVGVHTRFGRLTIIDWLEFFLLHEAHHMFTIFQLSH